MYEPNVSELLSRLGTGDLVLDVGGWACPFNRAQWVIDEGPYATRGFYKSFGGPASQGGAIEHFSEKSWVQRDICAREPWPFADGQFDFAICSHVLEDVRDPLWVCSELKRVAKRGYIETPSRLLETSRGQEHPRTVGLSHHRWFVDYHGSRITFLMKYHFVHSHFRFSFPRSFARRLTPARQVSWLWWESDFQVDERIVHGHETQMREIERYVAAHYRYSRARVMANRGWQLFARIGRGIFRRARSAGGG